MTEIRVLRGDTSRRNPEFEIGFPIFNPLEVDVVAWAKSLGMKSRRWRRTLASSDWPCLESQSPHGRTQVALYAKSAPSESRSCPGAGLVVYLHVVLHPGNLFLQARWQTGLQSFS